MLYVHSIETLGTHEGPGLRFVLFLQGCNLRCVYCHNPETQQCHIGTYRSTDELLCLVRQYREYYGARGGLTVSGGEPTLQAAGVCELLQAARAEGIHTALDTSGSVVSIDAKRAFDASDLVILDVKHIDPDRHRALTGADNRHSLHMAAYRERTGRPMWLRYVLVPGWTDQPRHLVAWCRHFEAYTSVVRIEILPYHGIGAHKYLGMGRAYPLKGVRAPHENEVAYARSIFAECLPNHEVVVRGL